MALKFLIPASAACLSVPLLAQTPATARAEATADQLRAATLEAGEGRKVADTLADELLGKFVIQEQAKAYAAMPRPAVTTRAHAATSPS